MKMQKSTARRLLAELSTALEKNIGEEIIVLSDSVKALMTDALAREELVETIENENSNV